MDNMILLTIGLILAYTSNYHVLGRSTIEGLLATGIVELVFEVVFATHLLNKTIGVI